MFESC